MKAKCAICESDFEATKRNHRCCSKRCRIRLWRAENKDAYNAQQREWRANNNERLNAKKRKGNATIPCPQCGGLFVRNRAQKFCSVRCRDKVKRANPAQREKQRVRQNNWRAVNKEQYRNYHRNYYHGYTRDRLFKKPWKPLLLSAKYRSVKLKIDFDLDEAWMESRWTGYCELTKLPFSSPEKRRGYKNKSFSPSIDKIDPAKGYTKNNCRLILFAVNCFKRDDSDVEMYAIAEALIANNPHRIDRMGS